MKQLGSLLGDEEDIGRRRQLAGAAFHTMWKIWLRGHKVSLRRRIRLYNAYVLPVLTYNCGTWGATDTAMAKLAAFHRGQLRKVMGIRWPERISNKELYKQTGCSDIRIHIAQARTRLFGHVLRLHKDAPAQASMDTYFDPGRRQRGRPRHAIATRLRSDMGMAGIRFHNEKDLKNLRTIATDRNRWRKIVKTVAANQILR